MKKAIFLTLICLILMTCDKDEGCDTNANLNSDCFNLDLTLDVQDFTSAGWSRERAQFIYQYPPSGPQERVRFVIYADIDSEFSATEGAIAEFQEGVTYAGSNASFTFNGNLSAGGIPAAFDLMFTKFDREENLASGTIEFSYSNDFGSEAFSSTFTNVPIKN